MLPTQSHFLLVALVVMSEAPSYPNFADPLQDSSTEPSPPLARLDPQDPVPVLPVPLRPPSYHSDDNSATNVGEEPTPEYFSEQEEHLTAPAPTYTRVRKNDEECILGGYNEYIEEYPVIRQRNHPSSRRRRVLASDEPSWYNAGILIVYTLFIALAVYFISTSITILNISCVSKRLSSPYILELNNVHANLSSFDLPQRRLNMTKINFAATEHIGIPDYIRFGLSEYCTDDDPHYESAKCHNYRDLNGNLGTIPYIYSRLIHEATGRNVKPSSITLPRLADLNSAISHRLLAGWMVVMFMVLHAIAVPGIVIIATATKDFVFVLKCQAVYSLASYPFAWAGLYHLNRCIFLVQNSFLKSYSTYGITVKGGDDFINFCISYIVIDGAIIMVGALSCFYQMLYKTTSCAMTENHASHSN